MLEGNALSDRGVMPNISRERLVHWVEHTLADLPHLTSAQRRFLSSLLGVRGWHLIVERDSPRESHAAAYAIGRAGVFALVFTDVVPEPARLREIRNHAEEAFAGIRFDSAQFVPHTIELVLLMPRASAAQTHDGALLVDESTLLATLTRAEHRLSPGRVGHVAATAAARLTWHKWISPHDAPVPEVVASGGLFEESDLHADTRDGALARPFRDWMTFLDPDQLTLVHANFTGPARFSGPAGTGKSVVALHRMAHFAKRNPGRVLFTSFVKTLPAYHQSGFARLAPQAVDRAQFIGLHAWARAFLRSRNVDFNLDERAVNTSFAHAWQGARNVLAKVEGTDFGYWADETNRVIKGRGITDLPEYLGIKRAGREGITLHGGRRKYVWEDWFLPYQKGLDARGVHDFNDVIELAIQELRERPLDDTEDFALVVVDEVQDFTLIELRLVHQILGGGPKAQLLLVGDGQQQVYSGGWKLSEAGIPLAGGRGRVLRTNYRNRKAILRFSKRVQAGNTVDDLDGGPGFVLGDSDATLPDGCAVETRISRRDINAALPDAIRAAGLPPHSDIAVIVNSHRDVDRFQRVLRSAGLETISLERYDGTQLDPIKVGTVHRAKGMDFAAVFHITGEPPTDITQLTGGARDRAELLARQMLVAVSRPRDYLWVAYLTD
ncbi:UvrD-helicase domain-containing protein [Nocardia salmonicida]|uniref:UvrD-helicase domain-containing protein n=1 Tax=Nocardia salmonicida TaxID=53431 RepID=UPI00378778C5